jgi:hypothetical protein
MHPGTRLLQRTLLGGYIVECGWVKGPVLAPDLEEAQNIAREMESKRPEPPQPTRRKKIWRLMTPRAKYRAKIRAHNRRLASRQS